MATVIDSLMIELGLDTSKFSDAQKKVVESLRKTDEQANKSNQSIQRGVKQTGGEFDKVKDSIVALATALLSFDAIKSFVMGMTKSNTQLGISSNLLNVSARELKTWAAVAEKAGAAPDTFTNAIKTMQEQAALFHMGKGGQDFAQAFSILGLNPDKDINNIGKISDALIKFRDKFGTKEAQNLAKTLGFGDDASFNAMLKGGDALNELYKGMDKYNDKSEEATLEAGKLNEKIVDLSAAFKQLKDRTYLTYGPGLESLLEFAREAIELYTKLSDIRAQSRDLPIFSLPILLYNKLTGKTAQNQQTAQQQENNSKQLMDYFMSQGWSKEQAAGIVGNLTQESGLNPNAKNANGMRGIAQWNKDRQKDFENWAGFGIDDPRANLMKQAEFVQYELTKGKEQKAGIELSKQNTTIGASNAIFSEYERPGDDTAAKRAQYALQYSQMTGASGYERSGDDTAAKRAQYALQYSQMTGASANAPAGSSTANNTQVEINSINVNTQATDADGISKSIGQSIQNNSLINAGVGANR